MKRTIEVSQFSMQLYSRSTNMGQALVDFVVGFTDGHVIFIDVEVPEST